MTLRHAPTATVRHNETLPGGEVEISITVRYIQADCQPEPGRIRDRAVSIMHYLITHCGEYQMNMTD